MMQNVGGYFHVFKINLMGEFLCHFLVVRKIRLLKNAQQLVKLCLVSVSDSLYLHNKTIMGEFFHKIAFYS